MSDSNTADSQTTIRPDATEPMPGHLERAAEALLSEWHTHPTGGQSLLLVADWLLIMAERASAETHE